MANLSKQISSLFLPLLLSGVTETIVPKTTWQVSEEKVKKKMRKFDSNYHRQLKNIPGETPAASGAEPPCAAPLRPPRPGHAGAQSDPV